MCVLYKKATKQFVQYDKSTTRSELVTDVSLASDLTREEARKLLHKCTKKLKDFKISERSQFPCSIQKAETVAVIKSAVAEAVFASNEEKEEAKETNSSLDWRPRLTSDNSPALPESVPDFNGCPEINISNQPEKDEASQDAFLRILSESEVICDKKYKKETLPLLFPELPKPVQMKTPRRCFTPKERRDIYLRDRGVCGICGNFVAPDNFSIDHIIPISKGGTYDYDNLQCCCKKCNQLKDDALPDDFFDMVLSAIDFQVNKKKNKKMRKKLKKICKNAFIPESEKKKTKKKHKK